MIAGSAAYGRPISVRPTRRPRSGWSVGAHRGRKPSINTFLSRSRVSSVLIEPPMTFEPRPSTVTGAAFFLRSVNRVSLAVRQAWPSATRWPASSPSIPWGKRGGHGIGQRQVHVVAAQQDVLADGQARQGQVAPFVGHGDQGEVGRPAADVADQDDVADLDLLAPFLALDGEPGVKGGLRLLEEVTCFSPALPAASMVSSRATGSNDAGTVRKTSWFSSRSAAVLPATRVFQASRRCSR